MQEIEVKFLDVDPQDIEKKLVALGATKEFDDLFEEWIFYQPEWKTFSGRARVRMENGRVKVSYKETTRKTSEGNTEIEFEASSKEAAIAFIEKLGIPLVRHQQKRRIQFAYDNAAVVIDFWPQIPPLIEIETSSAAEIAKIANKLGLDMKDACELDARQVIQNIYKVDVDSMREYVFEK